MPWKIMPNWMFPTRIWRTRSHIGGMIYLIPRRRMSFQKKNHKRLRLTHSRYWYRCMFDELFPPYCASTVMRWTPTWVKQSDPSGRYVGAILFLYFLSSYVELNWQNRTVLLPHTPKSMTTSTNKSSAWASPLDLLVFANARWKVLTWRISYHFHFPLSKFSFTLWMGAITCFLVMNLQSLASFVLFHTLVAI